MKSRTLCTTAIAFLLTLAPTALASTTWYVDGVNGNDHNNCKTRTTACKTIGHAISLASSGDTIGVGPATYTENLNISISLRIIGSGATTTVIDGGAVGTVIFISSTSAQVTLSKVTIQNGFAQNGAGISNVGTLTISDTTVSRNTAGCGALPFGEISGGGIFNAGELTINNSSISGNKVTASPCGGLNRGGGIDNSGNLRINNSTVSGNTTQGPLAWGGGVYNVGTLVINSSTFTGNSAQSSVNNDVCGGGVCNRGTLVINSSTVAQNSANSASAGGGIWTSGTATLQNSIVADSPNGGDCAGTMTSKGYNLSSDGTCNFNGPGDLNNIDPNLGPLQNNGGPTQTRALLTGSPAIDAGNPNGCTDGNGHLLKTDQRGKARPDKEDTGGCDMGAFERQSD